jgi:hypothetical protein
MSLDLFWEAFFYTFFTAGIAAYSFLTYTIISSSSAYESCFEEWSIITIVLLVLFCVLLGVVSGGVT